MSGLSVLAVDDERPALEELGYLVSTCDDVADVVTVDSSTEALRELRRRRFDVVLLDVRMPGIDGLELASLLDRFAAPPAVVFVTAHEEHALAAFDVNAAAYLLKPVARERLAGVLARVAGGDRSQGDDGVDPLDHLAAEAPGRTTIVERADVAWVESAGDYIRLHLADGASHLVRLPLAVLEERWAPHGFARIHRGYLVALRSVRELRTEGAQTVVRVAGRDLPVSRRHLRALRDRLVGGGW